MMNFFCTSIGNFVYMCTVSHLATDCERLWEFIADLVTLCAQICGVQFPPTSALFPSARGRIYQENTGGSVVRICLQIQKTWEMPVQFLGQEDPLEWEMATCSGTLAW